MTFIKNNLTKLLSIGLLIAILGLNYFGFCFGESRFISDEEKIKLAINKVLNEYPTIERSKQFYRDLPKEYQNIDFYSYGNGSSVGIPKVPISYRDMKEFLELNPNCCIVTQDYHSKYKDDLGGDSTTFFSRLTGRKTSIVAVQYKIRYRNKAGNIESKGMEFYSGMDNCGLFVCDYCF
jgi:hypothetical protein